MKSLEICDDIRLAGEVIRYHTWPHIRQQSVGEHSWQLCRILMIICREDLMLFRLMKHAVIHDIGEVGAGDAPYPIKANNPDLKQIMDRIENETIDNLTLWWDVKDDIILQQAEQWVFKLAEFIEMWEWGLEEMLRGNQFAKKVVDRCGSAVETALHPHKAMIPEVATRARVYVDRRKELWA